MIEVLAANCSHVIQFRVFRLVSSLKFSRVLLEVIFCFGTLLLNFIRSSFQIVLLTACLHYFSRCSVVILLQLLELTSLFEKSFRTRPALLFQDLLSLQVSSFSTLHELVAVVLVPDFEMVKRVRQCFDFLFALSNLTIQFITVPLNLLLFLSSFDNIVSL